MKEKILKILIYTFGGICLVTYMAIRYQPLFNSLLREPIVNGYWDKTKFGELYYFNMISHFREWDLPPAQPKFEYSSRQASVNDAEIIAFGDSYFEFSRHKQFAERIADDFNIKVHTVNTYRPLEYIESKNYHDTLPKLVIFERVERGLPIDFEKKHVLQVKKDISVSKSAAIMNKMINLVFYSKSEELYDAMLKRSYLTTWMYSQIATIKFDWFGFISKLTPLYKKDGDYSWLFYYDQVNEKKSSFYYSFTQEQIDSICDNMADLATQLKKKYNMDLVYLPLPAKYTLYHTILNQDAYNNFLPLLYKGLDKRGVKYIQVYNDFISCRDTIYYRTDEHWRQEGIDIAYKKTIDYIKSDADLKNYLNNNLHLANK
ncbi:MAG: hypothetical protein IQL11_05465 [Bacteroidales bacterium]|nr:hypothetical protein [Bacteroidales bacterium]